MGSGKVWGFGSKVDVERRFALGEIASVSVTTGSVSVRVLRGDSPNEVRIHYYGWSFQSPGFVLEKVGDAVTFSDVSNAQNVGDLRLEVYLPESFGKRLSITTSSGNVSIDSLDAAAIIQESSSGNVSAGRLRADEVSLSSTSGGKKIESLAAKRLDSRSTSGSITVDSCAVAEAKIVASSGSVSLTYAAAAARRLSAQTTSGGVTARFPRGAAVSLDARSNSGRISSDFPALAGIDREKSVSLAIATASGAIRVLAR